MFLEEIIGIIRSSEGIEEGSMNEDEYSKEGRGRYGGVFLMRKYY